jgi:DNA helicase HerA-like ATPase
MRVLAEQLSAAGVPVVTADVKGDVSGIAEPGETGGPLEKRAIELGEAFTPTGFPAEYFAVGGVGPGIPLRVTLTDFGPLLLAKVLDATEAQEGSLQLLFHYADEKGLPLLDLPDLRAMLQFLTTDEGKAELKALGAVAPATVGTLLRKLIALEDGGGNELFGEPQLDIADLMRVAPDGRGVISCVELPAVQDKPQLWSTALMWLVAELFETLPEAGDLPKPKLVVFLDEAHLLFDGASKVFVDSVVQTVRLIRSKGVGLFFVTQMAKDVHEDVLAQLGNRVQHAVRAFTPKDAKALRETISTFPQTDLYDLEELLPKLGIGEAVVTILDEHGVPTPVVHTKIKAPVSKLGPAADVAGAAQRSPLFAMYGTRTDSRSARELLAARLEVATAPGVGSAPADEKPPFTVDVPPPPRRSSGRSRSRDDGGGIGDFLGSRQGRALEREVVRGIFGLLRKKL